jgi:hypothetical protein
MQHHNMPTAHLYPNLAFRLHLCTINMLRLTTLLLSLTPTILAFPTPSTTHLYICTDSSFRGNCTNIQLEVSSCRKLYLKDMKDLVEG